MALPAHRVIAHKEYGNTGHPGRKSDPVYDMNWRRARVAAFNPTPAAPAPFEEDDMPQAVTAQIPTGVETVFAFPPAGPGEPGGAAGWGRAWLTVLGDRFGQPGGDIHARIAIRGGDGIWRPALGEHMNTVLPAGTPATIPLTPGDNAVVFSDSDGDLGACVEYARA